MESQTARGGRGDNAPATKHTPGTWVKIGDWLPPANEMVLCLRRWIPGGGPNIGIEQTEICIARRNGNPLNIYRADPGAYTNWESFEGHSWSDATVDSWMAMPSTNAIAAAPTLYAIVKAEYDDNHGFATLPLGYPADRAKAIVDVVRAVEGGAA